MGKQYCGSFAASVRMRGARLLFREGFRKSVQMAIMPGTISGERIDYGHHERNPRRASERLPKTRRPTWTKRSAPATLQSPDRMGPGWRDDSSSRLREALS